jgi:hypothetical protein
MNGAIPIRDGVVACVVGGGILLCGATAFVAWARAVVIWWKLGRYLEEHNPERLLWLVGAREMGTYYHFRPGRLMRYVFSNEDDADPTILSCKGCIRQSVRLTLLMSIAIVALVLLIIIYTVVSYHLQKCNMA